MATPTWAPTVAQVAAYVPSRTIEIGTTNELGTFSADTRPTAAQVESLAADGARKVLVGVGSTLQDHLVDAAQSIAAMYAAAQVELRYFPEQLTTERSPYEQLLEGFDKELAWLKAQVDEGVELPGDGDVITAGMPAYGFPAVGAPASGVQW